MHGANRVVLVLIAAMVLLSGAAESTSDEEVRDGCTSGSALLAAGRLDDAQAALIKVWSVDPSATCADETVDALLDEISTRRSSAFRAVAEAGAHVADEEQIAAVEAYARALGFDSSNTDAIAGLAAVLSQPDDPLEQAKLIRQARELLEAGLGEQANAVLDKLVTEAGGDIPDDLNRGSQPYEWWRSIWNRLAPLALTTLQLLLVLAVVGWVVLWIVRLWAGRDSASWRWLSTKPPLISQLLSPRIQFKDFEQGNAPFAIGKTLTGTIRYGIGALGREDQVPGFYDQTGVDVAGDLGETLDKVSSEAARFAFLWSALQRLLPSDRIKIEGFLHANGRAGITVLLNDGRGVAASYEAHGPPATTATNSNTESDDGEVKEGPNLTESDYTDLAMGSAAWILCQLDHYINGEPAEGHSCKSTGDAQLALDEAGQDRVNRLTAALAIDPENWNAVYALGYTALRSGDNDGAIRLLSELDRYGSNNMLWFSSKYNLAVAHLHRYRQGYGQENDLEKAREHAGHLMGLLEACYGQYPHEWKPPSVNCQDVTMRKRETRTSESDFGKVRRLTDREKTRLQGIYAQSGGITWALFADVLLTAAAARSRESSKEAMPSPRAESAAQVATGWINAARPGDAAGAGTAYNLACYHATAMKHWRKEQQLDTRPGLEEDNELTDHGREALGYLRQALELSLGKNRSLLVDWAPKDPSLGPLNTLAEFRWLLAEYGGTDGFKTNDFMVTAAESIEFNASRGPVGGLCVAERGGKLIYDPSYGPIPFSGILVADHIKIRDNPDPNSAVPLAYFSFLEGDQARITERRSLLNLPVLKLPQPMVATPGTSDRTDPSALEPGHYRDLHVKEGASLVGGEYHFRSLIISRGTLTVGTNSRIVVRKRLMIKGRIQPRTHAGKCADDAWPRLELHVEAADDLGEFACTVDEKLVNVDITARQGTVHITKHGSINYGSIIAKRVVVNGYVTPRLLSR